MSFIADPLDQFTPAPVGEEPLERIIQAWRGERDKYFLCNPSHGRNYPISVYRDADTTRVWGPGTLDGATKFIDLKCAEAVRAVIDYPGLQPSGPPSPG